MKKNSLWGLLVFFLMMFVVGCGGKSASLEGKVVDGKGQPLAKVKVTAKMSQPLKGYEQFETTTGFDGSFKFGKLFPASEYQLMFFSVRRGEEQEMNINSGPEGQTRMLPGPVTLRFTVSKEGVITDTKTDLEWFAGPGPGPHAVMTWNQAQSWVAGLKAEGGGWRIPTIPELKSLYINKYFIHALFKLDVWCVWTGQQGESSSGCCLTSLEGKDCWDFRGDKARGCAFAVRSPRR